jgi:DNA polymerase-1
MAKPGKLILIDGNSLLYRAFFALPHLTNSRGEVTNAVYGFTVMLYKLLDEEQPDSMAAAFDLPGPTFRHERYVEYKAQRERAPDELRPQIGMAKEVLDAMGVPVFECPSFEADDVIGAMAHQAEAAGYQVLVVTGDLDALQLVSDRTSVMITRRGITDTVIYDIEGVRQRFGVEPRQLVDVKALRGDPSDNIPGVPGVGEKTAERLIREYQSVENLVAHLDEIGDQRLAQALRAHLDQIRLSKELLLIDRDAPAEPDWQACRVTLGDRAKLIEVFGRLDFKSLVSKLGGNDRAQPVNLEVVADAAGLSALAERVRAAGRCAVAAVFAAGAPALHGLAAAAPGEAVGCALAAPASDLLAAELPAADDIWAALGPVLEDPAVAKSGHDLKQLWRALREVGIELRGLALDTMVASYLVNPGRQTHRLSDVAFDFLQIPPPPEPFDGAAAWEAGDVEAVARDAAERASLVERLTAPLRERLAELGLDRLLDELEVPLIPILARMEEAGIAVDRDYLGRLSVTLDERIQAIERRIHELAGEEFTINSPRQLGQILFDKLGFKPTRRTKTGYSTDAETLATLAEDQEIARQVLEYRELTKLKSTYVDALARLADERTGRVHTTFNQTVTATGRLSSSDPNLQNIPVRTELGREIRCAFIAGEPGWQLLSADYSQIELRVLAHIARDDRMIAIFEDDRDLHTATACEVFDVAPDEVTPDMRRLAKVVNFGIPYGIGDVRLGKNMGVSTAEARSYMERYFQRFPGVKQYIEDIVEQARESGYVATLLGRRRPLPDLRSRSRQLREFAERTAVNTPIQGSAADIIKQAMLEVDRELTESGSRARMLLQVHDELVFEVPAAELASVAEGVIRLMSGAYPLCVPLKVEAKAGSNWCHMTPLGSGQEVGQ